VQPYVLLGLEIQSRGHEVVLATEARMEGLVQQLAKGLLGYHCISGDPTGMLWEKKYQVHRVWLFLEEVLGLGLLQQHFMLSRCGLFIHLCVCMAWVLPIVQLLSLEECAQVQ
jgi:hypothetical protein